MSGRVSNVNSWIPKIQHIYQAHTHLEIKIKEKKVQLYDRLNYVLGDVLYFPWFSLFCWWLFTNNSSSSPLERNSGEAFLLIYESWEWNVIRVDSRICSLFLSSKHATFLHFSLVLIKKYCWLKLKWICLLIWN